MGELVRFRAMLTERRLLKGVRGSGKVMYFMDKHAAETARQASEEELRRIPKLGFASRITEGGQQLDLEDAIKNAS